MRIRFQSKILVPFAGLIALIQCATVLAVISITGQDAARRTREQFEIGTTVFRADMSDRESKLLNWVQILSRDFAFIEAIATQESRTISSALVNHGARVGADLALLVKLDGTIVAGHGQLQEKVEHHPVRALLARAKSERRAVGIVMLDGSLYQVVVMPVYGPLHLAWLCMGFMIDDDVARSVKRKTLLEVSFLTQDESRRHLLVASSLMASQRNRVQEQLAEARIVQEASRPFVLDTTDYLTQFIPLGDASSPDGPSFHVMLQASRSEALKSHRRLRTILVALTLIALAISTLVASMLARSITRPVQALMEAAQRISQGDYDKPVRITSRDEMATLAEAFNEMQQGISARQAQIVYQSSHDRLTGLYSRVVAHDRLDATIRRATEDAPVAVLILSIDRFKEINDKLGHHMGDRVLQAVADAISDRTREVDTAVRLGGDEFMMILAHHDAESARSVAEQLARGLSDSVSVSDLRVSINLSVGIAVHPEHGSRSDVLLRRADIALYGAKRATWPIALYEHGQDEQHLRRLAVIEELSNGLSKGEFTLYYQPKIALPSRDVVQVEALLRWTSSKLGTVSPDEFIPLAEESGHIHAITRFALDTALRHCAEWRANGLNVAVAVNLSALDLAHDSTLGYVSESLSRHKVPASCLLLEVTETAMIENLSQSIRTLKTLHDSGISIALDDFGTGQSSLAQLKRMPVDELKIDKTFVQNLKQDSEDACIVRAAIEIGHSMGLQIVAEGVEDESCLRLLEELECDLIQGYFISKPIAADCFEKWVRDYYSERVPPSTEALPH